MLRILTYSLIVLIFTPFTVLAEDALITKSMIESKNTALEKALNNRSDAEEAIRVMHEQISEDALFRLSVSNPLHNKGHKSPTMEMNKKDYINSYIQGTHYVSNYHIDIKTVRFEYKEGRAHSTDHIIEYGTMENEFNGGKAFVSRTTCQTEHELINNIAVAIAARCHTDISFEESV